MRKPFYFLIGLLVLALACNAGGASTPTPDLFATLSASTPLSANPAATADPAQTPTVSFNLPTPVQPTDAVSTLSVPTSSSGNPPTGKIVFTCQIFKVQASNQICIINADGTGFRRLTNDSTRQHYYPSLAPDGKSVVYAAFLEANVYEIYEMDLSGGFKQLTKKLGILNAPEISPNGDYIIFKFSTGTSDKNAIWIMDRNGENVGNIPRALGWDPTWSPDGKYILFASDMDGMIQLYTIRVNGKELHKVESGLPAIRGRSDWAPNGQFIVTYSGEPWKRDVYIMEPDGSNARLLSPPGGNAQGASISPDSQWVAFTAYYDHPNDDHGCEIYILRIDGTDLRRLTSNDYCDYQPRWGP